MAKPYSRGRRNDRGNQVRKNERIRAREVRLIGSDGKQVGVVSRDEALEAAKKAGLDLVEISGSARPPVCRILDFGKYMYELSKRQKENKAKANSSAKIKEVKFRVRTEEHDYMTKLRHAEEFLYKGNKLKMSLMFRGRENEHKELGIEVLAKAGNDLAHIGQPDSEPKLSGRHVNMVVSPLPAARRKLIYNEHVSTEADSEQEPESEDKD